MNEIYFIKSFNKAQLLWNVMEEIINQLSDQFQLII